MRKSKLHLTFSTRYGHPYILEQSKDILLEIFTFLDVKSLCRCEQVCKQFSVVSQNDYLWKVQHDKLFDNWVTTFGSTERLYNRYQNRKSLIEALFSYSISCAFYMNPTDIPIMKDNIINWVIYYNRGCFWKRLTLAKLNYSLWRPSSWLQKTLQDPVDKFWQQWKDFGKVLGMFLLGYGVLIGALWAWVQSEPAWLLDACKNSRTGCKPEILLYLLCQLTVMAVGIRILWAVVRNKNRNKWRRRTKGK